MTAPTLSGFTTNFAYAENGGAVFIDTDVTLADAEGNWNGGRIVVSGLGATEDIGVISEGIGAGQFFAAGDTLFIMNDVGGGILVPTPAATITDNGTSVTIAFNANVSTSLVERVLEHLTYANTSDDPDATARFTVRVTDAANQVAVGTDFTERPDAIDPLNGVNVGNSPFPALVDWDRDGDLDVVATGFSIGAWRYSYLRNNGDGTLTRLTGADNPFGGISGFTPTPAFGDIDGDGDLDMVAGESNGTFRTWLGGPGGLVEATGASNPFSGFDVGNFAAAALGDIDGDNDLDLVSGSTSGTFATYRNNGGLSFTQLNGTDNPFNGIDIGTFSVAALGDVDGDGDLDLVAGADGGNIFYFRKDPSGYVQQTGGNNPFGGVTVPGQSFPGLGDIDGDGDVDLLVGVELAGTFNWYEHDGGTVTVAITAIEDLPIAADDGFATDELTPETGSLFADNGGGADVDPDGPSFAITAVNGSAAAVGVQIRLASGALLTVHANGTFSYDPGGAFQYVPGPASGGSNLTATDSFTYTLTGGDTATVTIAVSGVDNDDVVRGSAGNDMLDGGIGANTLSYADAGAGVTVSIAMAGPQDTVGAGIDVVTNFRNLTGSGFADALGGTNGANLLDGGAGADRMTGWAGDDVYIVDHAGDRAFERANGGTDTVRASVSFNAQGQYIENVVLTGSAALDAWGNSLANTLTGNAGVNLLHGGLGDDSYHVQTLGDRAIELDGQGHDTVYAGINYSLAGSFVEDLVLTMASDGIGIGNGLDNAITGGTRDDLLIGNGGDDTLDGGLGADTLHGGDGDDLFVVDDAGDIVVEASGGGTDTVLAAVSWFLGAHYVEKLALTGSAVGGTGNGLDNVLTGNAQANILYGREGNDTLDGGLGADRMRGEQGDDVYHVDQAGDLAIEFANEGTDTVIASIGYDLAGQHVERLTLTGSAAINGSGNSLANDIAGNDAANILNGREGDDTLTGGGGGDTLIGGEGSDTLAGGAGADRFWLGGTPGAGNVDTIADFEAGIDTIMLSQTLFATLAPGALAASQFALGTAALDATDRILYDAATGTLWYDPDANGAAAAVHVAILSTGLALTSDDFTIVP